MSYITVEVDVSIDDIADQIDDEMLEDWYEERFGCKESRWDVIYENRRRMTTDEFLKHIDQLIQDNTGRIL